MIQKGSINNIQKTPLPNYGESKCLVSNLNRFEKHAHQSPLSLKMVVEGTENYKVEGTSYRLKAGNYIIINEADELELNVDSKTKTKGICIYPPKALLDEVYQYQLENKVDLLERKDTTEKLRFTTKIQPLAMKSKTARFVQSQFNSCSRLTSDEWLAFYMQLAHFMVEDQLEIEGKLKHLKSTKKSTKEELFRRVSLAQEYIHDHPHERPDLDALAQLTSLSKYHFLRSFKSVFNCSPYQYLLQMKLSEAKQLVFQGCSYVEAAERVGYSDPKNLRKALRGLG
ncbi:MAG: AraC family transcriptional regulator [Flavobacteriales bacterium]|nr:AraC family transcriptional regulator [Flavobacteriales bacterium]